MSMPRPPFSEREPDPPRGRDILARVFGGSCVLLPVVLGVFALVTVLDLLPTAGSSGSPRAIPTSVIPSGVPRIPPVNPLARQQPHPTATPESVQPQAIPTMPPLADNVATPKRKPRSPDPEPSTDYFIVVDGDSGAVLFQRNAYEPIAPASLTKIMTAVLAIEHGGLSERVKVDVDAAAFPDSSVMGLRVNSELTLEDLLYGLILASGNDAALAIGRCVGGSDEAFVRMMNEKAAWLKLGSTHFANPHGFDADDHYSSPADMVALARYAMQYPEFRTVVATRARDVRGEYDSYALRNVNGILTSYPGADGVKTGQTPSAGRSLVATAVRDGHRIYVAFMRSGAGAVSDGVLLLDWAFSSHTWESRRAQSDRG